MKLLENMQDCFTIIINIFFIYQVAIGLFAFKKPALKKIITDKKHTFLAVIPARNEENVIQNLIKSLQIQKYDPNCIEICVIADNCTDQTAAIARELGVRVFERNNNEKCTKGYALEWFFENNLNSLVKNYDAVCIFDADNIVDPHFFSVMNHRLRTGDKIVQGFRDIKNLTDTWVSACYGLFYMFSQKFYHEARSKIGLSSLINGTGFMVATDVLLEENGWHTRSLTEDIEFSCLQVAKGRTVVTEMNAIVYDEQPISFSQSIIQRLRWSLGHIQVIPLCIGKIFKGLVKHNPLRVFDVLIYLFSVPMLIVSALSFIIDVSLSLLYNVTPITIMTFIVDLVFPSVNFYVVPILLCIVTLAVYRRKFVPMLTGIVMYPFFLLSWVFITVYALFRPNAKWTPIKHGLSLNRVSDKERVKSKKKTRIAG